VELWKWKSDAGLENYDSIDKSILFLQVKLLRMK
jgi:hypothetical protein